MGRNCTQRLAHHKVLDAPHCNSSLSYNDAVDRTRDWCWIRTTCEYIVCIIYITCSYRRSLAGSGATDRTAMKADCQPWPRHRKNSSKNWRLFRHRYHENGGNDEQFYSTTMFWYRALPFSRFHQMLGFHLWATLDVTDGTPCGV